MKKISPLLIAISSLLLGACVTGDQLKSEVTRNPAPLEKFSSYTRFVVSKIQLPEPYASQGAYQNAVEKIQEALDLRLNPVIAQWNAPAAGAAAPRTLLIEPVIADIKFVAPKAKGSDDEKAVSSAVIVTLMITERATGMTVATPEFYARAAPNAGPAGAKAADEAMLVRVANRVADYIIANYDQPVGGPSGMGQLGK